MDGIRVGVVGVGHHGVYHCEKYSRLPGVRLVAVSDADQARAAEIGRKFGVEAPSDYRDLIGRVDAVSVVVPTRFHFAIARDFLKAGVHVLVEKPITTTVKEADGLIAAARRSGAVLMVGHLERFNGAVAAVRPRVTTPGYIEAMRLSPFPERSLDVDVVLDVMIHDLDLILSFVDADISWIHAVGVPVVTDKVDIANARIAFANGCVATVTASRVSREKARELRIFQPDAYFSLDNATQQAVMCRRVPGIGRREIAAEGIPVEKVDTLSEEIKDFLGSVRTGTSLGASGAEGRRALSVAMKILSAMETPLSRTGQSMARSSRRRRL